MDPVLFCVGALGYPKNVSEYEYAGGIMGEPVEVIRSEVTGLMIPAHAEIVLEGYLHPNKLKSEGPFGEFQGYYGRPGGPTPYIDVTCIRHRNDPILTCTLMSDYPACDQNAYYAIARSGRLLDDLETLGIPGVRGAYFYPAAAGSHGLVVVSIEQRYAGHAAQVAALTAQAPSTAYMTKWIVVVDHDVDPTDWNQVIWAMSTRCHPPDDIDILRGTWSTYLDPTQNPPENRPYGAKVLVNACMEHRYLKQFARRTSLRRSTYQRVAENWYKLGLPGGPPELRSLDDVEEATEA
jgi:4-hydroxy-3-polyprenylbenzoate decarboxylase